MSKTYTRTYNKLYKFWTQLNYFAVMQLKDVPQALKILKPQSHQ